MDSERDIFSAVPALEGFIWPLVVGVAQLVQDADGWLDVESTDDLLFVREGGRVRTAVQMKHHRAGGALSDRSIDLWKTLRVWAKAEMKGPAISLYELRTTASVAGTVLIDSEGAITDVPGFASRLTAIADAAPNEELEKAYAAWKACPRKEDILRKARFIGNLDTIDFAVVQLEEALKKMLPDERPLSQVRRSVMGWMLESVCERAKKGPLRVEYTEVRSIIREACLLVLPTVLTITTPPVSEDAAGAVMASGPRFIRQLELLDADGDVLVTAAQTFLQANLQREEWLSSRMTGRQAVDAFDRGLRNHWRLVHASKRQAYIKGRVDAHEAGWGVLEACMGHGETLSGLRSSELTQGTYHKLANAIRDGVGWHPDFAVLLTDEKDDNAE